MGYSRILPCLRPWLSIQLRRLAMNDSEFDMSHLELRLQSDEACEDAHAA